MNELFFFIMITIVCVFDPARDWFMAGTRFFPYYKPLDWFFGLFRWVYRSEWKDSYSHVAWHWLKWIAFYTPFIVYCYVVPMNYAWWIIGAIYAHLLWRTTYNTLTWIMRNKTNE